MSWFKKNPEVVKLLDELEKFKLFCSREAYVNGWDGFVFDEKNYNNMNSFAWRAYKDFLNGRGPRKVKRKFKGKNQGRFASNRRVN